MEEPKSHGEMQFSRNPTHCEISNCAELLKDGGTIIHFNLGGSEQFSIKICESHTRQVKCDQLRAFSIEGSSGSYTADIRPVPATEAEQPRLSEGEAKDEENDDQVS